jgi:hypothetical protein
VLAVVVAVPVVVADDLAVIVEVRPLLRRGCAG